MGISGRILHVEIDLEHIMSLFAEDIIYTCTYSQFYAIPRWYLLKYSQLRIFLKWQTPRQVSLKSWAMSAGERAVLRFMDNQGQIASDLGNGTVQVKGKFTLTIQCKEGWTKN